MRQYFKIILLFFLLVPFFYCCAQKKANVKGRSYLHGDSVVHWINWNLLFTSSSLADTTHIYDGLEKYLIHWAKSKNSKARLVFKFQHCPCDTLLTNMDATLLYGSGNSVPPPPTQPNPGPSGDYTLGNNFNMYIPGYLDSNYLDTKNLTPNLTAIVRGPSSGQYNKTLAVIDTGLDTLLFRKAYPNTIWSGDLLWQDENNTTLFNVVIGERTDVLMDSTHFKHGTAVTGVVLSQMNIMSPNRIPQIMSIRAFDDSEKGSIYTVSCAMSYAIQNNADFINASWGYFGKEDPVLKSYLVKASKKSIRIIAAAGNTPGHHDQSKICNPSVNHRNSLDRLRRLDSLFYPACFAPVIPNLVSVTQLHLRLIPPAKPVKIPCYYQNFSSNYITVGTLEESTPNSICCEFKPPFLAQGIEGSSFATPVLTGILMSRVTEKSLDIKDYILNNNDNRPAVTSQFTNRGDYYFFKN
jgi:Subtilase family